MTSTTTRFDILMATDGRFPGGNTSSVVEEIEAQHRAGYRTGLLHLPSPVLGRARPFAPKMRRILDEGKAELVLGTDRVEAKLLLARHPTVFIDPPRGLPQIDADQVILAVNQVAADDRGVEPYYDVQHVHRQVERLIGKEATWAPIGPRVRQSLAPMSGAIPLLAWDWENVIDVDAVRVTRESFVADRPIIGRHSRGHWSKWPDTKQDILAAYPHDPRYGVRILGGTEAPADILDRIPANWVDLPFNSIPIRDFLATIDFFVYFHHPGLVEAFGRVVLEALAAGAVAIVPPYLEPLFGDVCLYGTPADVRRHVDELYGDWDAYTARSRAGVDLARRRFSYNTHVDRVEKLIGPPDKPGPEAATSGKASVGAARKQAGHGRAAGTAKAGAAKAGVTKAGAAKAGLASAASGAESPRRTLVVDVRWDTTGDTVLANVVDRAADDGPAAVVVPAWRAADVAGAAASAGSKTRGRSGRETAVETFPWGLAELSAAQRRRYVALRLGGLIATHQPTRVVVVDGGGPDAKVVFGAVRDPNIDVLRVHRRRPLPAPAVGEPAPGVATPDSDPSPPDWQLPDGWSVTHRAAGLRPVAAPSRGRLARLRRKAPKRVRGAARRTMSALRRRRVQLLERIVPSAGLMLFEVDEAELTLPARAPVTHPTPERLPVALVVVTSSDVAAAPTLRAIVERAQISAAFRPAVLAPPSWVDEAVEFGVTLETLIPRSQWLALYGGGWSEYVRRRVDETCHVIHPTTVAYVDRTIEPAGETDEPAVVLDVLETARTRRRA
ncbi:glycosyltransferase [Phytoactinopolyspora limicola]|uniref:glycosyltransferase n=1 Tax=Phytoactinopolyspora limicola TaxID=2715536 RepID=UPI0014098B64|nr:glycosyltransferase [Phytoactinopolyspora limicola]